MVKAKKKSPAKKPAKKKPRAAAKSAPSRLRTALMREFYSRIKKPPPPGWQWPAHGQRLDRSLDEVLPVLELLSKVGFGSMADRQTELAVPVVPGSLRAMVVDSIVASHWPDGVSDRDKLVSIAALIDKMLQAANAHGGGGGPSGWPPH